MRINPAGRFPDRSAGLSFNPPRINGRAGPLFMPRTLGAGAFRNMAKRTLEELDAVLRQAGLPGLADLRRQGFTEVQIQKLLNGSKPTPPPPKPRKFDNQ
jgi:hypothetical protein